MQTFVCFDRLSIRAVRLISTCSSHSGSPGSNGGRQTAPPFNNIAQPGACVINSTNLIASLLLRLSWQQAIILHKCYCPFPLRDQPKGFGSDGNSLFISDHKTIKCSQLIRRLTSSYHCRRSILSLHTVLFCYYISMLMLGYIQSFGEEHANSETRIQRWMEFKGATEQRLLHKIHPSSPPMKKLTPASLTMNRNTSLLIIMAWNVCRPEQATWEVLSDTLLVYSHAPSSLLLL